MPKGSANVAERRVMVFAICDLRENAVFRLSRGFSTLSPHLHSPSKY